MEFFGGDQEWESLSNMFSFEDSDHFLSANAPEINATSNNDLFSPSDHNTHFYIPGRAGDISFRADDYAFEPMDFTVPSVFSDGAMADEILQMRDDDYPFVGMQLKRKQPEKLTQVPEKVAQVSKEANKTKRKSKKSKKLDVQIDEEINNGFGNENICPNACSSEERGKSKRPATEKRRERINERLKTLQTLVPNGTKVDISTMLEEAVDYVKFLQLQIKLLSSDDMGIYQKILPNL